MLHRNSAVPLVLLISLVFCGCSRRDYRVAADGEVYGLISGKLCPQWMLPPRPVEPDPTSRLADLSDPDRPPIPPDDAVAACLMANPNGYRGSKVYRHRSRVPFIEYPSWRADLPQDEEGVVELTRDEIVPLALLHSRSYQTEYEGLYLSALNLSLERFAFDVQWAGSTGAFFDAVGNQAPPGNRFLRVPNRATLSKNLAGGGQLLVDFANTFLWEFSGTQVSRASSSLLVQLTQPILRGAFREVRLEPLTQAERNLLYTTRQFARFRREFYVNITGNNGYLRLLSLAQGIRNQEKNLESLERNLREHEALAAAGLVRAIQVDQVYQDYEQGRLQMLAVNQALQGALDRFKIQLGLPPTLDVRIDEEALKPFELSDPQFDQLEAANERLRLSLLQFDRINVPNLDFLEESYASVSHIMDQLPPLMETVQEELARWKKRLDKEGDVADADELQRRRDLAEELEDYLFDSSQKLTTDRETVRRQWDALEDTQAADAWDNLKNLSSENVRERLADLFVVQTQVRVYLIEIQPVDIDSTLAVTIARNNRLDLMNARGRVVDGLRRVEVAADALEGDLDFVVETELGTDPDQVDAFRFDESATRYRAGVRFDGPLNRRAERNAYRATQISYQRARRDFMAARDNIDLEIRNALRQLEFTRFSFEVNRRQLITAVRQVEEAQFGLRSSTEPNSSLTRDLLSALQQLLSAKNSLITSWSSYETARMNLFRDLGVMQVDGEGVWVNEHDTIATTDETDSFAESLGQAPPEPDVTESGGLGPAEFDPESRTFELVPPEPQR